MQHILEVHEKCDKYPCPICQGGLASCTVCGGAEACMPTDCPGKRLDGDTLDKIQAGELDFCNGKWLIKQPQND